MKISHINNWAVVVLPKELGLPRANVRIDGRYDWLRGLYYFTQWEKLLLAVYLIEKHEYDILDIYKDCYKQCVDIIAESDDSHRAYARTIMDYEIGDKSWMKDTLHHDVEMDGISYTVSFTTRWMDDLLDDGISFADQLRVFVEFKKIVKEQVPFYSLKKHIIDTINEYLNPKSSN